MPNIDYITKILGIQNFYVKELVIDDKRIDIWIEREKEIYNCSKCGQVSLVSWGNWEMEVQDLKMSGKSVYLHFRKHRVKCNCDNNAYVERLDFINEYEVVTKRLEEEIYYLCKRMPANAVTEMYGLDWGTVKRIDKKNILARIKKEWTFENLYRISVDEYAYSKHKCITVISNLDIRKVIYVIEGRKKEDLDKFFNTVLGVERCKKIVTVTMDLCSPFRSSVKDNLPNATLVFDKFHLMKLLHEKMEEIRKQEQEKLEQEGKHIMKNQRWLILKGQEKLRDDQRQKLHELLLQNENLSKSYLLKEEFREFYRLDLSYISNPVDIMQMAYNYLNGWIQKVEESGIEQLIKFTKTLNRWQNGVLAYFVQRVTNALSEGLNNKISSIQKRAYGYRDLNYFILKIYQQCGAI
jgi:transposase